MCQATIFKVPLLATVEIVWLLLLLPAFSFSFCLLNTDYLHTILSISNIHSAKGGPCEAMPLFSPLRVFVVNPCHSAGPNLSHSYLSWSWHLWWPSHGKKGRPHSSCNEGTGVAFPDCNSSLLLLLLRDLPYLSDFY
ncbi:hypothetical protein P389DRAFT_62482 [Cystobasidium minutum MCA 4210]|uniref:uncharacterized protein n=1 Tax=Cystobasidium minutum MCA 4210 TaxID=1397322 RepID=UPI0034CFE818|eukprot:jgi/Rhomi1/62482/CE62481_51